MRHAHLGALAAALTTLALALPSGASANSTQPPAAPIAATKPPPGCTHTFTIADHRGYARRVFKRSRITHQATRRLQTLRRCQTHGPRATHAARRAERRLARWRSLYH